MKNTEVSISVVLYKNRPEEINKVVSCAIESLAQHIYVIDNSPTDDLKKVVVPLSEKIIYIYGQGNVGFGAGHNIALRKSIEQNAQYHLVLNPDIEFQADVLPQLQLFMEENPNVGLVMPKIVYPNGDIQYLCKLLPTPFDWIFRRFCPFKSIIAKRNEKYELRASGYNKTMNIPYLSGCFMLFRTAVLSEIGIFDERIFMYGEDTDITRRIHKKYQTVFYPKVVVTHKHNKESYRSHRLLWIHIKAAIYYFNKWGWFFDKERRAINRQVLREII